MQRRPGEFNLTLRAAGDGASGVRHACMAQDARRAVKHGPVTGQRSTRPRSEDSTQYGTACTSPGSFFAHHIASISAVVVYTDAQELCLAGEAVR